MLEFYYDTLDKPNAAKKGFIRGEMIQAQNALQRSRGKYLTKPPENLQYLIDIVNGLPLDGLQPLMKPEALQAKVEAEVEPRHERREEFNIGVKLDAAACGSTKKLPSELRAYVWLGEWKGGSFHVEPFDVHPDVWAAVTGKKVKQPVKIFWPVLPGAFQRYAEVWDAYEKLHGIAKFARGDLHGWNLLKLGRHASIPTAVEIDTQGVVRERKSLFSKVIEGQSVEAVRIRECPICTLIFWAGRIDAGQCGTPKCKSALSSRLNRDPELRELYNKARRKKRLNQKKARENVRSLMKAGKVMNATAKSE